MTKKLEKLQKKKPRSKRDEEIADLRSDYQRSVAKMLERVDRTAKPRYTSTKCPMIPTANRVVMRRDEAKGMSKIIHTPDNRRDQPTTGTIVAVCPAQQADLGHLVGKRYLFPRFGGTEVEFKGQPLWVVLQIEELLAEITVADLELEQDPLESMVPHQ